MEKHCCSTHTWYQGKKDIFLNNFNSFNGNFKSRMVFFLMDFLFCQNWQWNSTISPLTFRTLSPDMLIFVLGKVSTFAYTDMLINCLPPYYRLPKLIIFKFCWSWYFAILYFTLSTEIYKMLTSVRYGALIVSPTFEDIFSYVNIMSVLNLFSCLVIYQKYAHLYIAP